jgi:poly(glycerol-phosphate) alpha-glucosyltransferase
MKKRIANWLFEGANIRSAAVLHALNDAEAEDIRRYGYTGPIAVIPNGVELALRTSLAPVSARRRTLLFIGRIHPKKGLAELIAAWSEAIKQDPSLAS